MSDSELEALIKRAGDAITRHKEQCKSSLRKERQ